jgi:hypothetical protein
MRYGATAVSLNSKTGPILVTTTSMDSCWTGCPHHQNNRGTCYALYGPQRLWWNKISSGKYGMPLTKLFFFLRKHITRHTIWRHNVAGDLPSRKENGVRIDERFVRMLYKVNRECKGIGFTYTHRPWKLNQDIIRESNQNGFTINASCDSFEDAVDCYNHNIPTTITVSESQKDNVTVNGIKFMTCPAQTGTAKNCLECKLCSNANRNIVIMFSAHGLKAKHIHTTQD